MRKRHAILILATSTTISMTAFCAAWARYAGARNTAENTQTSMQQLQCDVDELLRLRATDTAVAPAQRPTEDVLALVRASLADAGLPSRHLLSIDDETDVALPGSSAAVDGPSLRRQSLTISLRELQPIQLGAFVRHWQQLQRAWSVSRIEMSHERSSGRGQQESEADTYSVRLRISAFYMDTSDQR